MHIAPAFVSWTLRWHPDVERFGPVDDASAGFVSLVLLPIPVYGASLLETGRNFKFLAQACSFAHYMVGRHLPLQQHPRACQCIEGSTFHHPPHGLLCSGVGCVILYEDLRYQRRTHPSTRGECGQRTHACASAVTEAGCATYTRSA